MGPISTRHASRTAERTCTFQGPEICGSSVPSPDTVFRRWHHRGFTNGKHASTLVLSRSSAARECLFFAGLLADLPSSASCADHDAGSPFILVSAPVSKSATAQPSTRYPLLVHMHGVLQSLCLERTHMARPSLSYLEVPWKRD